MAVVLCGTVFAASLDCSLEPKSARIGDELTLSIRVNGAEGKPVKILWPEDGDFQLLNMDSAAYAQSGAFNFVIAAYDTGVRALGQIPVVIGSGAAAETLLTSPQQVMIQATLPDSASVIKANKNYREQKFRWRELLAYWWIAAVVAAAALGYWIWRKFFRKIPAHEQFREPELPPADQAIRDLILLRDQRYAQRGMLKEFYSEYSHIMRYYVERRYSFPALEMTTFELEYEFDDAKFPVDFRQRLLPVLRQSDLVKFAKYLPSAADCDGLIELGFELVTKTKLVEPNVEESKKKSSETEVNA